MVYPTGDVLFRNDRIKILTTESDADIYYTVNSAIIPTSFTGEHFSPDRPINFMNDFSIKTFELMCVAVCKGKLDSVVVSKYYKEIRKDEDRPANLVHEEAKISEDMGMSRPVHEVKQEKDEIDNTSQEGGLDINQVSTPGRMSVPGTPGQIMREVSVGIGSLRATSSNPYNSGRPSSRRQTDCNQGADSDDDPLI